MTLKIQGSSIRNEFVTCCYCQKEFSWLNGYKNLQKGVYRAICAKCNKREGI